MFLSELKRNCYSILTHCEINFGKGFYQSIFRIMIERAGSNKNVPLVWWVGVMFWNKQMCSSFAKVFGLLVFTFFCSIKLYLTIFQSYILTNLFNICILWKDVVSNSNMVSWLHVAYTFYPSNKIFEQWQSVFDHVFKKLAFFVDEFFSIQYYRNWLFKNSNCVI